MDTATRPEVGEPAAFFDALIFDNSFAALPPPFHSRQAPSPLPAPYLVAFNPDVARLIGVDPVEPGSADFVETFAGNRPLPGSAPLATVYAGHQFGVFVPQLGDGRAILLGELIGPSGGRWELQLKGAGQTPYSRQADGRSVLRSAIREYLCSEAMHHLGIPTTRALCVVGSDLPVYREVRETAAVLTRLAPSHLRFGSFEYFHWRGQPEQVRQLADWALARHFPHLTPGAYADLLAEIVERSARLSATWQAVGFAHGVLNTDNMSVLGLTLDYGPFGFMEKFDSGWVCNHSDHQGRYAFGAQPDVVWWNLKALAAAFESLIADAERKAVVATYPASFRDRYTAALRAKLGLATRAPNDLELAIDLLRLMQAAGADYTQFWRDLARFNTAPDADNAWLFGAMASADPVRAWCERYRLRLATEGRSPAARALAMNRVNPRYVLRNHLAERAIRAAVTERDYVEIARLHDLLRDPYTERPGWDAYTQPLPEGAEAVAVSCSS